MENLDWAKKLMESDKDINKMLVLCLLTGSIMLRNGAETYRVEDTIKRIGTSRGADFVDSFVIPTSIFLSISQADEAVSFVKRVSPEQMNLNKIHLLNEFSRKFVNSSMSIEDGINRVLEIDTIYEYTDRDIILFAGVVSGTFTGLFGSNFTDMIMSFIIGTLTMRLIYYIHKFEFISLVDNFIAGFSAAFLSFLAEKIGLATSMDLIIIGVIMPLLPGYALTNAIRDAIIGDHVASLSRALDAVLTGIAMALGVVVVLNFI